MPGHACHRRKEQRDGVRNDGILKNFARTTETVFSLREFESLLDGGRKLKIKFGTDVTAPFLHIGHAVNLWMMRALQERGHLVQFLVGDFTTLIGDPTGRSAARRVPSAEERRKSEEEFIRQIARVLITDDRERFEIRRNSEWYAGMGLADFLGLLGQVTLGRLSSRDMFRRRVESGSDVWTNELIYPVLQGWDSVMLESDLTIVGNDQLFNEMMGRFFQERRGQPPQVVLTTKITPGLDGRNKQSKSLGNFIAINESARSMFGKAMSLPDVLIPSWLEVYTTRPLEEVEELREGLARGSLHPREAKLELATALVERWHGVEKARLERAWFEATFSRRDFPADAPPVLLRTGSHDVLAMLGIVLPGASRAELRRLLAQGAVSLDGKRLGASSGVCSIAEGERRELRVGKRRFFSLIGDPESAASREK